MRVALVANSTWNFYNFRTNIIQALIQEGHEVVLISPEDDYLTLLLEKIPLRHIIIHALKRKSTNPWHDISFYREIKRIYRDIKPDLCIHFTIKPNIYGNLAAKACGIKSIAVVTGLGYVFLRANGLLKISNQLYKYSFSKADKVLFENQDDLKLFVDTKLVSEKKAIAVNGCGVDIERFKPLIHQSQKNQKGLVFTFIGRLLRDKGIMEFLGAAEEIEAQYPHISFWVVGETDPYNPSSIDKNLLVPYIEKNIIKYFGQLDDIRPIIQSSDCIILPSYREGMPKVITEVMAMEKPVITTTTAGCRELVEDKVDGLLVPIKDTHALSHSIRYFSTLSSEYKDAMGKKARAKMEQYYDDRLIAAEYLRIIHSI
jgi:glycosyltransferase involved in cell wall biosynthesis